MRGRLLGLRDGGKRCGGGRSLLFLRGRRLRLRERDLGLLGYRRGSPLLERDLYRSDLCIGSIGERLPVSSVESICFNKEMMMRIRNIRKTIRNCFTKNVQRKLQYKK